jgi:hypothetical protein
MGGGGFPGGMGGHPRQQQQHHHHGGGAGGPGGLYDDSPAVLQLNSDSFLAAGSGWLYLVRPERRLVSLLCECIVKTCVV